MEHEDKSSVMISLESG